MKIKKHGTSFEKKKKEQGEEFKCDKCGCEFYAKDDEYYVDSGYNWNGSSITYTVITQNTLVCSCPECHKICRKYKDKYNYNTVTTGTTFNSDKTNCTKTSIGDVPDNGYVTICQNDTVTDAVTLTGTVETNGGINE